MRHQIDVSSRMGIRQYLSMEERTKCYADTFYCEFKCVQDIVVVVNGGSQGDGIGDQREPWGDNYRSVTHSGKACQRHHNKGVCGKHLSMQQVLVSCDVQCERWLL